MDKLTEFVYRHQSYVKMKNGVILATDRFLGYDTSCRRKIFPDVPVPIFREIKHNNHSQYNYIYDLLS
jgi:hypothetical protein